MVGILKLVALVAAIPVLAVYAVLYGAILFLRAIPTLGNWTWCGLFHKQEVTGQDEIWTHTRCLICGRTYSERRCDGSPV